MRQLLTDLRGNPIYNFAQRRLRRMRLYQNHSTTLLICIRNRAWDDVQRRALSHPTEISIRDEVSGNTPLHEACRLDPPKEVVEVLASTARVKNKHGATPLHIAASHRCSAEALRTLMECAAGIPSTCGSCLQDVSPTAELSNIGRAPIHYACMSFRGLESEAFQLLLDKTIQEGYIEIERRFELDDFIDEEFEELEDYFKPAEEKKIVNVMSMKDASGQTPLGLLFRRYRERVRGVINTVDRLRSDNPPDRAALASAVTVQADLGELWERARFIIGRLTEELHKEGQNSAFSGCSSPGEAAVRQEAAAWATEQHQVFSDSGDDTNLSEESAEETPEKTDRRRFRIVHASVALIGYGCPPEMIRLAISMHPQQVREMDEDGNLPIHIAASAASYTTTVDMVSPSTVAAVLSAATDMDDMSVLSDAMSFFSSATIQQTTNPFDKVLKILIQQYPEAATIPQGRSGQLPLVMAIESGQRTWDDGIRTLLHAYPPAMHNKKLFEPELYPNVLSLVACGKADFGRKDLELSGILDELLSSRHSRGATRKKEKRRRHQVNTRTTLYQLIRMKPDWLTKEGRLPLEG